MTQIAAFPYAALERTTRREVAGEASVAAALRHGFAFDEAAHVVGNLLGEPARVSAQRHFGDVPSLAANATFVIDALEVVAHVTAESSLVSACVAQLLGGRAPLEDPRQPIGTVLDGAFNAAALWLAKRLCHAGVPRLVPTPKAPLRGVRFGVIITTATARHAAFVTLRTSEDGLRRPTASTASPARTLQRLGELPLSLSLFCGEALTGLGDLESASAGDFWVPGAGMWLDNALCGRGVVAAPRADGGTRVDLDGEKIVVSGAAHRLHATTEMTSDDTLPDATPGRAALDADVIVRVEVARVTMTAEQWANLRAGDVVQTDQPVGALVRLYAAGQPFAEGDLVDVDGSLGVRLHRAPRGER